MLPCVCNDDFFLSLPALSTAWQSFLSQHAVHRMACRLRFRMSEPQHRVFAGQPWRRLSLRPGEGKEAAGDEPCAGLWQSAAGKDWRGERYSFKTIHLLEMNCFGADTTDCRMPCLPLDAVRPRPLPRFHLPQPFQFQAYLVDFLTARHICSALQDEPCRPAQPRIVQSVSVDSEPSRCLCGKSSTTPPRLFAAPSQLAWIPLPGPYHTTWVAVWTGRAPDMCSQVMLDQLSASADAGVQVALNGVSASVDLECSPVFEWDEQFDHLVVAGLCARDYFQYGPIAVQLCREIYAPPNTT